MEESRIIAFTKRVSELNAAASRLMWRRLHPEPRAREAEIYAARRGPYETAYDIIRGYQGYRPIEQP